MAEEDLMKARKKKLEKLKGLGINPYPNRYARSHLITDIIKTSNNIKPGIKTKRKASIAGRVMAKRDMGKILFLDLKDDSGMIQLYIDKGEITELDFKVLEEVDIGDFLGVKGFVYRTKRKELSIWVKGLSMLAKSLRPLPAKWHGLKDLELRYRKRYLDLIMNPEVKDKFVKKIGLIKLFKDWMDDHGFLEVQTPILELVYGGAMAEPFVTHHNALNTDFYLRISTEMYLKRLMVGGFERIYEINTVFRNEGIDASHLQEIPNHFEFYWAYQTYEGLMKFAENMISHVLKKVLGTLKLKYQGVTFNFKIPYKRVKFRDVILKETGIDINIHNTYEKLKKEIINKKIKEVDPKKCLHYAALLDEFFKRIVRPKMIQPVFITHYPIELKPLAKRNEVDRTKSNAFQLLVNGWELINAFDELNDPVEQHERLLEQRRYSDMGDKEAHPLDEDFIGAMEYGMPPMAGFGFGLDRFCTLVLGFENIRGSVFFPTLKPE